MHLRAVAHCNQSLFLTSMTKIGHSAFENCRSLKSIIIPDGLQEIGDYAFVNCKSLQSVIIPDSLKFTGNALFAGCSKDLQIDSIQFQIRDGLVLTANGCRVDSCLDIEDVVVPAGVTEIGDNAFLCCSLKTVVIADGVKKNLRLCFCRLCFLGICCYAR